MEPSRVRSEDHSIAHESDVVAVRRRVRELARLTGFDAFATAALVTAVSELTRNTWVHGGGGSATIEEIREGDRAGIRVRFVDRGPGITDLDRALRGGFSTTHTMGLGLSGSRRLVDEFEIETEPGAGTRVVITKWMPY